MKKELLTIGIIALFLTGELKAKPLKEKKMEKKCSKCSGVMWLGKDQNNKYWYVCEKCENMEEA